VLTRPSSVEAGADGKRLIVLKLHNEDAIFTAKLGPGARGFTPQRLTLESWESNVVDWTKDSRAVVFESLRGGRWSILRQEVDQTTPRPLISGSETMSLRF